MLEINESVRRPEALVHLVAGDNFPGLLQQQGKNGKRLALQADAHAMLPQFPGSKVKLKDAEAKNATRRLRLLIRHRSPPRARTKHWMEAISVAKSNPIGDLGGYQQSIPCLLPVWQGLIDHAASVRTTGD